MQQFKKSESMRWEEGINPFACPPPVKSEASTRALLCAIGPAPGYKPPAPEPGSGQQTAVPAERTARVRVSGQAGQTQSRAVPAYCWPASPLPPKYMDDTARSLQRLRPRGYRL